MSIWNELDPEREAKPEFLAFLDGLLTFRPGTLRQVDPDQGTISLEARVGGRPKTLVHYMGYAHEPVLRLLHRHLGTNFSVMDIYDRFGIEKAACWEEDYFVEGDSKYSRKYPGPDRPDWLVGVPFCFEGAPYAELLIVDWLWNYQDPLADLSSNIPYDQPAQILLADEACSAASHPDYTWFISQTYALGTRKSSASE